MRYLVKVPWSNGRKMVVQADNLRVVHPEVMRRKGRLGPFTEVEGTGRRNGKVLEVRPRGPAKPEQDQADHRRLGGTGPVYGEPIREDGRRANRSWMTLHVPAAADDVKKTVRVLRPQEAGAIEDLDRQIADAHRLIDDLRSKRKAAVRTAFTKGHRVALKDLAEAAREGQPLT